MARTSKRRDTRHSTNKNKTVPRAAKQNAAKQNAVVSQPQTEFWIWVAMILAAGAFLRLWNLGDAPFSHDESIHAHFALHFADYKYDPTYHGPLLYHLTALVFRFLGDSDWSARLTPALLGIALLGLVLATRRWMDRGALWSAALLAISPSLTAYSRRLIHDALVLLLTLGAVLCFQIAREQGSHRTTGRMARIALAVLCALLLATKANAWFIIAMLLGFWLVRIPSDATRGIRTPKAGGAKWPWWIPTALLAVVALASCRVYYVPLAPITTFVAPRFVMPQSTFTVLCAVAVGLMLEWLRRAPRSEEVAQNANSEAARWDWVSPLAALVAAFWVVAFLYGHGVSWWSEPGQIGSLLWADVLGPQSALPRMLRYWGGQQKTPRLPGPHDYYIVLMLLYELPIVAAAIAGIARASRNRTPFSDLLLWWAFSSFVLYSLANEKVPWLLVHILLPLCLLAGPWLSDCARGFSLHMSTHVEGKAWRRVIFALSCAAGALFLGRGVMATSFGRAGDNHEPLFYAFSTESFRDTLFAALKKTQGRHGTLWVGADKEWPNVWYLRPSAPFVNDSIAFFSPLPPIADGSAASELRVAQSPTLDEWKGLLSSRRVSLQQWQMAQQQLYGRRSKTVDFIVWPRAGWSAIRPETFARFWLFRVANEDNGVLNEWSHNEVVISTPPDAR